MDEDVLKAKFFPERVDCYVGGDISLNSVSFWNSWRNLSNASSRSLALRPMMMILDADALAKERAISKPIPLPPPVMRTVLSAWLREGLVGEMEGYVSRWCVVVSLARDMIRLTGTVKMLGKTRFDGAFYECVGTVSGQWDLCLRLTVVSKNDSL